MAKSMTGYGKADVTDNGRRFVVEIKSVNHRYNDITVKLPRILNLFEDGVKSRIKQEISRGKTDVFISFESLSEKDTNITLNTVLADAYMQRLSEIKERYGLESCVTPEMIARYPDVLFVEKSIDNDAVLNEMWETLQAALDVALSSFVEMRRREGEKLRADMLEKNANIKSLVVQLHKLAPQAVTEHNEKMHRRIEELLGDVKVDEGRFLTEIAVFADKASIDEELTRLESHLSQFEEILEADEPIGKKLDFLVQEMNREANTIASKANNIEITRLALNVKSEIEKIREQVQNIE